MNPGALLRHFDGGIWQRNLQTVPQKALPDDPNFPDAASAKAALAKILKDPKS
jgi:hypothetical protein